MMKDVTRLIQHAAQGAMLAKLTPCLRRLRNDERGNVALMAALFAAPLIGATGLGVDYTRSSAYRTQLDSAAGSAMLAAIDTARALLNNNPNISDADVFAAVKTRMANVFAARAPRKSDFSFVSVITTAQRIGDTISVSIVYKAKVTTTFSAILGVREIPLAGSNSLNGAYDATPSQNSDPNLIISENFDRGVSIPKGKSYTTIANYNNWITSGSGLEIGYAATYGATPPNGAQYVAELDSTMNTAIARKVFLPNDTYELRYWIKDRVQYDEYDPAWVCGSKTSDVDWATDPAGKWGYKTNRIGVYLDIALSNTPPKTLAPATNSLIDVCVNTGQKWIERSIKITITQPRFFWLTFQGEGASDSYGAAISDIRLCKNVCKGALASDFPWAPGRSLFTDGFETPSGAPGSTGAQKTLDDSGTNAGWDKLPEGWTTFPKNQIDFSQWGPGGAYGVYGIELDGSGPAPTNRGITRRMILTPGYYRLRYHYISMKTWGTGAQTLCGLTDIPGQIALTGAYTAGSGRPADTARVGVYIDADRNVSHPETPAGYNSTAVWKNNDGGAPTKPRLPLNQVDACTYATTYTERTINFRIIRSGFYWMTFRADGTSDSNGGGIDRVQLTALGGLTTAAPAGVVTIPAPGLTPGAPIVMNGVQIAAK